MNKRQTGVVRSYEWARQKGVTEIYHAYKSVSGRKIQAWENCKRIYAEHPTHISPLCIIGANSFQFSAGFEFTDSENGQVRFCYITKSGVEEWDK